jgi:uncharacterized membrane protein
VVLLLGRGIAPLSGGPVLDLGRLPGDLLRADPAGFLWLGLLAIFAAPVSRVAVALIAYVREADWLMAGVSVAILLVLAIAVGSAVVSTV